MRLIVHGQQAFGQAVFERLIEQTEDVVAIYCALDKGTRTDPLKQSAENAGVPVFQPLAYKNPEVADQMRGLNADLCIMAYVTLIVPSEVLNVPKFGTIQYHPSLLPDHKGPSSINWPIIQGKSKTGLSIFWPDDGLDTGPVLLQKEVDIEPDDTLGSLYFNKLFPQGVDAMLEALEMVRNGSAPKLPQDPTAGSYEGWCAKDDALIDWTRPVRIVYNLIRGTNPQPGAWTTRNGETLQIFDCLKNDSANEPAGYVTEVSDSGIHVAASGGEIVIQKVRTDAGKISAAEYAESTKISVGDQFGI